MRLRLDQMVCCNWKAHLVHVCGQPVQPWTVLWRKGKIQILDFNRHGRFEALRVSSDRKHGVVIGMLSFTSEDGGVNQYAANNLNQTVLSFSYWVRLSNCQTLNIHSLPLSSKRATGNTWLRCRGQLLSKLLNTCQSTQLQSTNGAGTCWFSLFELSTLPFDKGKPEFDPRAMYELPGVF